MTKVQIRPCMDLDGGEVTQCETSEADYFGVYIGEPGEFMWAADFSSHTDALNWATEVAENYEYKLEDICEF